MSYFNLHEEFKIMTFADQIRKTRKKAFLSQEALAGKLKVSLSTVNRWETGKSKPNLSTMKHIKAFCEESSIDYSPLEESWLSFGSLTTKD